MKTNPSSSDSVKYACCFQVFSTGTLADDLQTVFFRFLVRKIIGTETVANGKKALKPVTLMVFKEDAVASKQQYRDGRERQEGVETSCSDCF